MPRVSLIKQGLNTKLPQCLSGRGGAGAGLATPDLDDVKESVRQGVSKVAGRLSNMASGVFTSLQVKNLIPCLEHYFSHWEWRAFHK